MKVIWFALRMRRNYLYLLVKFITFNLGAAYEYKNEDNCSYYPSTTAVRLCC